MNEENDQFNRRPAFASHNAESLQLAWGEWQGKLASS